MGATIVFPGTLYNYGPRSFPLVAEDAALVVQAEAFVEAPNVENQAHGQICNTEDTRSCV